MTINLVTTSLKESWPRVDKEILFLGEWCKLYNNRSILKNYKHKTLEYHWNDRSKFYKDFLYLQRFYENVLASLALNLNEVHNVNYSKKYWRIVLDIVKQIYTYLF